MCLAHGTTGKLGTVAHCLICYHQTLQKKDRKNTMHLLIVITKHAKFRDITES